MKYIQKLKSTFDNNEYPVFSIRDIKFLLNSSKISNEYLYLMIHNMLKKDNIAKITRGIYTFHNEIAVAGFAFEPFYYGLECALWLRGISGQGTNFIIITTRNIRTGIRKFKGKNYIVHKINKEHMFGYDLLKYGNFWIPVSDIEKTFIDLLYFKNNIRDELFPDLVKSLNKEKLQKYLKKYDNKFKLKVMNQIKSMKNSIK